MAKKHPTPHDRLFRHTFSHRSEVILFIKNFLPAYIYEQLDFRTLKIQNTSFVNEKLENNYSDINYRCRWKNSEREVLLSFLFEHKSYAADFPEFQLLRYLLEGYEQQLKQEGPCSLIVPVLLYHGKEKFNEATFFECLELPDPMFGRFFPGFEFIKVDLGKYSDEELLAIGGSFLASMLLLFKHKQEKEFVLNNYQKIFIFVKGYKSRDATDRFVQTLVLYIFHSFKIEREEIAEIAGDLPKNVSDMFVSAYDIAVKTGEKRGIRKGEQIGIRKGEQIGIKKGETFLSFDLAFELISEIDGLDNETIAKRTRMPLSIIGRLCPIFDNKDRAAAQYLMFDTLKKIAPLTKHDKQRTERILQKYFTK
ncbi:MAG TPA: Rpn family recombination-promoting nuclease/putative transposase [Bacteroidetes bacterium]|nr:Rpn family recombination-promoting nuclease/putative transposase [Bacteroidota bacterium]